MMLWLCLQPLQTIVTPLWPPNATQNPPSSHLSQKSFSQKVAQLYTEITWGPRSYRENLSKIEFCPFFSECREDGWEKEDPMFIKLYLSTVKP